MNEELIRKFYDGLNLAEDDVSFEDFSSRVVSNPDLRKQLYDAGNFVDDNILYSDFERNILGSAVTDIEEDPTKNQVINNIKEDVTSTVKEREDLYNAVDKIRANTLGIGGFLGVSILDNVRSVVDNLNGRKTREQAEHDDLVKLRTDKADEHFFGPNATARVEDYEPQDLAEVYSGINLDNTYNVARQVGEDEEDPIFDSTIDQDIELLSKQLDGTSGFSGILGVGDEGEPLTRDDIGSMSIDDIENKLIERGFQGDAVDNAKLELGEKLLSIKDRISKEENIKAVATERALRPLISAYDKRESDLIKILESNPDNTIAQQKLEKVRSLKNEAVTRLDGLPEEFKLATATALLNSEIQEVYDERYENTSVLARTGIEAAQTLIDGAEKIPGSITNTFRTGLALVGNDRAGRDIVGDAYSQLPDNAFRDASREQRAVREDVAMISFEGEEYQVAYDKDGNISGVYNDFGNNAYNIINDEEKAAAFLLATETQNPDKETNAQFNADAMMSQVQTVGSDILAMVGISYLGGAALNAATKGAGVVANPKLMELMSSTLVFNNSYAMEAVREGGLLDPTAIGAYAFAGAAGEGLIEAINPLSNKILNRFVGGGARKTLSNAHVRALLNKKSLSSAGKFLGSLSANGVAEASEELIAEHLVKPTLNDYFNSRFDSRFEPQDVSVNDIVGTIAVAGVAGLIGGSVASSAELSPVFRQSEFYKTALQKAVEDPQLLGTMLEQAKQKDPSHTEQYDQVQALVEDVAKKSEKVLKDESIPDHVKKQYVTERFIIEHDSAKKEGIKSPVLIDKLDRSVNNAETELQLIDTAVAHGYSDLNISKVADITTLTGKQRPVMVAAMDNLMAMVNEKMPNATKQERLKKVRQISSQKQFRDTVKEEGLDVEALTGIVNKAIKPVTTEAPTAQNDSEQTPVTEPAPTPTTPVRGSAQSIVDAQREAKTQEKLVTDQVDKLQTQYDALSDKRTKDARNLKKQIADLQSQPDDVQLGQVGIVDSADTVEALNTKFDTNAEVIANNQGTQLAVTAAEQNAKILERINEINTTDDAASEGGGAVVTDEIYKEFVDTGKVDKAVLEGIADKIRSKTNLTQEENAIFQDKTSEINDILQTKVAEGTPETTTAEGTAQQPGKGQQVPGENQKTVEQPTVSEGPVKKDKKFANPTDTRTIKMNNATLGRIRSSINLDPKIEKESKTVDAMIQDAYDNWISKEPGYPLEEAIALTALNGDPLSPSQQIALAHAISELQEKLDEVRKLQLGASSIDKIAYQRAENDITYQLDMFTTAGIRAGSTAGRSLYIRSQLLNFNRYSEANMRSRMKETLAVHNETMTKQDEEMITKLAASIKKAKADLKDLQGSRDATVSEAKDVVASKEVDKINKGKSKNKLKSTKVKRSKNLKDSIDQLNKIIKGDIC